MKRMVIVVEGDEEYGTEDLETAMELMRQEFTGVSGRIEEV